MHIILRTILFFAIILIHSIAVYYFCSANWVNNSDFLIIWVSLVQVGITMSMLFYLGLVVKIPTNLKYFNLRKRENNGKLYENLGIKIFKFLLFRSPFVFLNRNLKVKGINKSQIQELESKMRIVEFGHLMGVILIFAIIPIMHVRSWKFTLWLTIFNVVFHIYPIFLQRYNRNRIDQLLK